MFVLGHMLWITVILYIHALLPHVCNAATEIKDNWLEDDENSDAKFLWKLGRRLLDSGDENYNGISYNSQADTFFIVFMIIFFFIVTIFIVCCYRFARSEEEGPILRITHPPPACPPDRRSIRLSSGSRPLAPPRTSTSLILLPEERQFDALFTGISNPVFSVLSDEQDRRESNSTHDLPPDYESAKKYAEKSTVDTIQDAENDPPPKYGQF